MTVPAFQSLMLTTLEALKDRRPAPVATVRERVADAHRLTNADLDELVPSGRQTRFVNRVAWCLSYLMRAGLVNREARGVYRVSDEGSKLLANPPDKITIRYLREECGLDEQLPPDGPKPPPGASLVVEELPVSPDEALQQIYEHIQGTLVAEVLDRVRSSDPGFLERTAVDLLTHMGYGTGQVTGGAGDRGIDGVVSEDKLGLDRVYVQTKRYGEGTAVGAGDVRNFAGALAAAGTGKGIFITTSHFTRSAEEVAGKVPHPIRLIDGEMELPRYDGHLSIWANQGGEPWREEGEGGIRPSTGSRSWGWREPGVVRGRWLASSSLRSRRSGTGSGRRTWTRVGAATV